LFYDVFALFAEMPLRLVLIEDHQALREGLEAHTRVYAIAIALREGHISGRVGGGA
jgi:hypothetical protein